MKSKLGAPEEVGYRTSAAAVARADALWSPGCVTLRPRMPSAGPAAGAALV